MKWWSHLEVVVFHLVRTPDGIVKAVIVRNNPHTLVRVVPVAVSFVFLPVTGVAVDTLWNSQAPVLNRNMLLLVVGLGFCDSCWNGLTVQIGPGGVGQRQECRGQVRMASHHVQGLVLWDARAADDEGDIDVGFYAQ